MSHTSVIMPTNANGDWDKSLTITWDAWNRITKVKDGATEVAAYQYDGLYRRTTKTISGETRHCYYSNRWKPLEERIDASTDAKQQYLWGARPDHRDELILRDRSTTVLPLLDERLYCAMDYFNPTAVFDKLGVVQERYGFSGFGIRRVMVPDFSARTASSFAVEFGLQGQFIDEETGWYDYGYRCYSPAIGRWLSRDPIHEDGGLNLYVTTKDSPINTIDFLGLHPPGGRLNNRLRERWKHLLAAAEAQFKQDVDTWITENCTQSPFPDSAARSFAVDPSPVPGKSKPIKIPLRPEDATIGPNGYRYSQVYDDQFGDNTQSDFQRINPIPGVHGSFRVDYETPITIEYKDNATDSSFFYRWSTVLYIEDQSFDQVVGFEIPTKHLQQTMSGSGSCCLD